MKTLLILRHAKSSWDDASLDDHDRPLNERGLKTAPLMGGLIKNNKLLPDVILSSTAVRAMETARLVAKSAGFTKPVETVPDFYASSPAEYIETLRAQTADKECIMIVGHNPELEVLLQVLTGHIEDLPTGALAQIHLPITEWRQLTSKTKGSLIRIFRPRTIFKELQEKASKNS